MKIDFAGLMEGFNGVLAMAGKVLPVAEALGLPDEVGKVANAVSAAVSVASNVVRRIDDGEIVAANGDAANVRAILTDLQTVNDNLAAKIAAS